MNAVIPCHFMPFDSTFFCFIFVCVHIFLKKTDNSVATIDDFCVGIDLLDSESGCDVTFKLNLIGRNRIDGVCNVFGRAKVCARV